MIQIDAYLGGPLKADSNLLVRVDAVVVQVAGQKEGDRGVVAVL